MRNSVHGQFLDFSGKVTSPADACVSHRRVDLLFRSDQTGLVSVRAHPTTNNSGKWSIKNVGHHGGSGRYIAKIHKITFKHTNRHTHSCKKAAAGVDFP